MAYAFALRQCVCVPILLRIASDTDIHLVLHNCSNHSFA